MNKDQSKVRRTEEDEVSYNTMLEVIIIIVILLYVIYIIVIDVVMNIFVDISTTRIFITQSLEFILQNLTNVPLLLLFVLLFMLKNFY
jgi:heme/copper-type cytochrome/quinol oxidase subunit 2